MLQLKNQTPFAAQLALFPNAQGVDSLYIIVKATFNIGLQWTLADEQQPLQAADEHWTDDPASSSLKTASDFHIGKPTTDIIMLGHAWAPQEREVQHMDVSLTVANLSKVIRVFGDRQWHNGGISAPQPFTSMPLVYEKAFGGMQKNGDQVILSEDRNPVGCGFTGKLTAKQVQGQALPNLEDPRQLIQNVGDVVNPACFSYISPSWLPRRSFAGTYDDNWQKNRAPYLPMDFNPRFFNMAHADLVCPSYLIGGESVQIVGVNPGGPITFNLPVVGIAASVAVKNRIERPVFNLETLVIEPDLMKLSLTWRAAMVCDKEALKIREVIVNLTRSQGQQAA